ncbi:tail fiber domain-containing protein [Alteromonas sp. A079]|uniref:tail fiber domain-containing protein n=1 Tax=Alteromonas sp. A079 TaxID=3410268 RepID=UPI003BA24362
MKLKNKIVSSVLCIPLFLPLTNVSADQQFQDDVVVKGSLCVGIDCVNGENFGFDTIRLKENNLRIRFTDTSASSSFPTIDWQITVNDSANGGLNYFRIENIDSAKSPLTILDSAPSNAIYVTGTGVGFNTSAPLVNLHVKAGNSPALRLEQDGSSGFSAQAWDVAGNETNFFVRDVTNSSKIPFKIRPSAPNNSLYIDNDGDIGFETSTPDGLFDIAHPSDANNHAVLVSPIGNFGINIDNGFNPLGLFDVQTTGGVSRFAVAADGSVGVGTSSPSGRFDVRDVTGSNTLFSIAESGETVSQSSFLDTNSANCSSGITCGRFSPIMTIAETNNDTTGRMLLNLKNNAPGWLGFENTSLNEQWFIANAPTSLNFAFSDFNAGTLTLPLQLFNNGDVKMAGTLYSNSSVYLKENITEVSLQKVLELVENLNVYTWNYIDNAEDNKHIGPMAQDFYKSFGLGKDNEHISSLDVSGVSLAAIQALYARIKALEEKVKIMEKNKG